MICDLALVKSPNCVCLEASGPTGTTFFNLSKQWRKWALLQNTEKSEELVKFKQISLLGKTEGVTFAYLDFAELYHNLVPKYKI